MFLDEKKIGEALAKVDVRSIRTLIAWLETQPEGREYDYTKSGECLLAQYLVAHGVAKYDLSSADVTAFFGDDSEIVQGYPRTFGGALERAVRLVA
jgi:hypothetical protein